MHQSKRLIEGPYAISTPRTFWAYLDYFKQNQAYVRISAFDSNRHSQKKESTREYEGIIQDCQVGVNEFNYGLYLVAGGRAAFYPKILLLSADGSKTLVDECVLTTYQSVQKDESGKLEKIVLENKDTDAFVLNRVIVEEVENGAKVDGSPGIKSV